MRRDQRPLPNCSITWGVLDSYDGFDEIFDLLQRRVFDESDSSGKVGASKVKSSTPDEPAAQPAPGAAAPFGYRASALQQSRSLDTKIIYSKTAWFLRVIAAVDPRDGAGF